MNKNKPNKYFAFISYKREDEEWAVWFHHELENYHLPATLNGRADLPKEVSHYRGNIKLVFGGNVGVGQRERAFGISPNNGQFGFNLPEEDCEIAVNNALGQQICQQRNAKGMTTLNLEDLNSGVFLCFRSIMFGNANSYY